MRPPFEDQWRTRFEEFASLRDDDAGIAGWSATGLDARVRKFVGLWKHEPIRKEWLDAGCGAGTYARILLDHGCRVVGADYSLSTLRKTVTRGLDGAAFVVADVRALPFPAESFEGVLCFGVTQALADSEPAVRELAGLVKPGGHLWIDALNQWCLVHVFGTLRRKALRRPRHLRYESPLRIKQLLHACGFGSVRLHWMPIMPGRFQRAQRIVDSALGSWIVEHVPPTGALVSHAFIVHAIKRPLDAGGNN